MWINRTKERLLAGETVYGPFLRMPGPISVELAAAAGFDFAVIDLEHGALELSQADGMICAARGAGITPLVRVPEVSGQGIHRVLDLGAQGVMAPQVGNEAQARTVSHASRFAPDGSRGLGGPARGNGWGALSAAELDRQVLTIVQIESQEAMENLEQIAAQPGIDVLFVGPMDLSQALGIPGEVTHPRLIAAIEQVILAAQQAGKTAGIYAGSAEAARFWRERGVRMIGTGLDTVLLGQAYRAVRKELG